MQDARPMTPNLRGSLLMVLAMALFAVEDMFIKWLTASMPIGQILAVSGLFGMVFFAVVARMQGRRTLTRAALHPAVWLRNLGEVVGTLAYITALASVPLATVSAVLQAMPLAVTLGAALFMGEQVGWRRWTAILIGFAGVLIVIRPGADGFSSTTLWVVVTVAALALRDLASRRIPATSNAAQVSTWGLAAVTVLGMGLLTQQSAVIPSTLQMMQLAGLLVFGTAGYWAIIAATRTGDVSVVSPFRYVRLVFAVIIGAVVFAENPDASTLIGSAIIVTSGLYTFMRQRLRLSTVTKPR
jgi:drug/metabolite transporter (DMT)-like permease